MKIEIDEEGWLKIQRGSIMGKQCCPFAAARNTEKPQRCGDWCPLFKEPVKTSIINGIKKEGIKIVLCKNSISCEVKDFTDHRK